MLDIDLIIQGVMSELSLAPKATATSSNPQKGVGQGLSMHQRRLRGLPSKSDGIASPSPSGVCFIGFYIDMGSTKIVHVKVG